MKKTIRFAAAAFAAIAALACSKDNDAHSENPADPDRTDKITYTIHASIDDGTVSGTRYAAEDDPANRAIRLTWTIYDLVYVVNDAAGGTVYNFKVSNVSEDGKSASLTCDNFPKGEKPAYAYNQTATSRYTLYPKSISIATQYFAADANNLTRIVPLCGHYDAASGQMVFQPMYAVLKLDITLPAAAQGTVSLVGIRSADDSIIFYRLYNGAYDITQTPFARATENNMKSSFTLSRYTQGNFTLPDDKRITLYLPVGPGDEPAGKQLIVDVTVGGVKYSATITGAPIRPGKCHPLTLPAEKWTAN